MGSEVIESVTWNEDEAVLCGCGHDRSSHRDFSDNTSCYSLSCTCMEFVASANYWVDGGRNGPLIAKAAALWIKPMDVVIDVTWGKGNFWTHYVHPGTFIRHDKYTFDGVDYRSLPEPMESADVIVFDPPYVSTGGRDTSTVPGMLDAYGLKLAGRTPHEVDLDIMLGMDECHRVLDPGGILMVKCCNYISSGKFHQGARYVLNLADRLGFVQVDEFLLAGRSGPQPKFNLDGTPRRQVHARRAHSYLFVFQKRLTDDPGALTVKA